MSKWTFLCEASRDIEGEPMSILEAEILGVPTIAPRGVGFIEDIETYIYEKSDLQYLVRILEK